MTLGALDRLQFDLPALVVTKHGHRDAELAARRDVDQIESAHPVPDQAGLDAGQRILDFVTTAPADSHLLLLISGGASALAEVLVPPNTFDDLIGLNRDMLARAMDIGAINARRREISRIKGGRLLSAYNGASVTVLAVSDVPGDELSVIGSGIGDPRLCDAGQVRTAIVASNATARSFAAKQAERLGLDVVECREGLHGEIGAVVDDIAASMIDGGAGVYVFGGEPFLELPDEPGEGGRNQALALLAAKRISGSQHIAFVAAGTDGGDGPGEAAGGFVTDESWERTPHGDEAIERANSGAWLRDSGGLIITGPTGTNVMDLAVGLKWR